MIDKWFKADLNFILDKKDRVVIICVDGNGDFLKELIPNNYVVFATENDIEELEAKYNIEKDHKEDKVVIITSRERSKLKFMREYCETNGCIEIKKIDNYISEKIFRKLNKNIQLLPEELIAAAKVSIGKNEDYWLNIIQKGKDSIFDIEKEILPFLDDPKSYSKKHDADVGQQFFEKLNAWLDRDFVEQPPEILAREAAHIIIGSLLKSKVPSKFLTVYNAWADSNRYESSLSEYINSFKISLDNQNVWNVHMDHPFSKIDNIWLEQISNNLQNETYVADKLEIIKKRSKSFIAAKVLDFCWQDVQTIIEFDETPIQNIASFDQAVNYYTKHFYKLDSAIRHLYTNFLNNKSIIKPFQEKYENILLQFLDKWFMYFKEYKENQTGLIAEILNSNQGKTAIIVGDGISYEISQSIVEKIRPKFEIENNYRFGGIPSVTLYNMSRLYISDNRIEEVHKKREDYLADNFKGNITFINLEDVSYSSDNSQYLICSCKDIDSIGEKMQQKALKYFDSIEELIAQKSDQLLSIGYDNVYIVSDHGFVLTGLLAESDKIEVNFEGKVHKGERYIETATKQNTTNDLIEKEFNNGEYKYLYFSKTIRPFKSPGVYGYAHGGISPQELIIPFIKISKTSSSIKALSVVISNKDDLASVVGDSFEIVLKSNSGDDGLFSSERKVLLLFLENGKQYNTSDIITIESNSVVKKEYHFNKKNQIEVILIDAKSKETLDKAVIKKDNSRNLDGLL